jgi:hypothetical protein
MRRTAFLAIVAIVGLIAATAAPEAKAALTGLAVTGANNAPGTQDPNYTLVSAPAGSPLSALEVAPANNAAGWVPTPNNGALWISPVANPAPSDLPTGLQSNGTYIPYDYRLTFTNTGATATFSFTVTTAADDDTQINLNGVTEKAANPGHQFEYGTLTTTTFTASVPAGTNTFDFLVFNTGNPPNNGPTDGPTGLLVTALAATAVAVPEPSTMAIAGLGAIGFIGYGLRRRKAKGA